MRNLLQCILIAIALLSLIFILSFWFLWGLRLELLHINFVSFLFIWQNRWFFFRFSSKTFIHVHFICFVSLFLRDADCMWWPCNSWVCFIWMLKLTFAYWYTFCLGMINDTFSIIIHWITRNWDIIKLVFNWLFVRKFLDDFAIGYKVPIEFSVNENRDFLQAHSFSIVIIKHIGYNCSDLLWVVFLNQRQSFCYNLIKNVTCFNIITFKRWEESACFKEN